MNAPSRSALLIVNPNSRQGSNTDIDEGVALLEKHGMAVIRFPCKSISNARQLIKEYRQKVDLVILGGGDGTISAVIGALYEYQLPFAVLPLGTANDFARSLDIPLDPREAFDTIIDDNRARIKLGKVNDTFFINVAHIGLGVEVTHELTPEIKARLGVFSYGAALLRAYRNNRSFRATIHAQGRRRRVRTIHLAIGNGRYYGGGNLIDDQSTMFDGTLSLYAVKPLNLRELLTLAPLLRNGQQYRSPMIDSCRSAAIRIETSRPREIHADGEPVARTPADFETIPDALEVVIGGDSSVGADSHSPTFEQVVDR